MSYYLRLKLRGHRKRAATGFNLVGGRRHYRATHKNYGKIIKETHLF